jgi:hypothetical protein
MPFNLLLLPLLGGFLLLHRAYRFRYYLARFDGHRLIFFSAAAGVFLLGLSTLLTYLVGYCLPSAAVAWHDVVPFDHSGKAFGAFFLGLGLPWLMNLVPRWKSLPCARRAIEHFGNDLEMLLLRSMDLEMPVLLTLGSGKVYVGYVVRLFHPDVERKHIRLLPVMSGYRSDNTQEVRFTTFYDVIRAQAQDPNSGFYGLLERDFEIVIPVAEVKSVSLFDARAFEAFDQLAE